MPAEYHIEQAKSGRSKCKKCKESIQKDQLRIGTTTERQTSSGETASMTSWHHIGCFTLPRAMKKEGATAESFVVEDLTDADDLLDEHKDEVIAAITESSASKTKKAAGAGTKSEKIDTSTAIGKIKYNFQEFQNAHDEDRPKKRAKLTNVEQEEIELYEAYKSNNLDELKDYMRWNRQVVGGKKDLLILKCIDGKMNGRLGRCPMCHGGKLAIRDEGAESCSCAGFFDEEFQARVPCNYQVALAKAPRLQPWFTQQPTEEEEKELDDIDERAKSGGGGAPVSKKNDDVVKKLLAKAKKVDWKTGGKDEIKATTAAMLKVAQKGGIALPSGSETKAVGKIIVMHGKSNTASDVMQMIIDEFGFTNDKAAASEAMDDAATSLCTVPANAKFYSAMDEFATLLRKMGDAFKSNAFRNAAVAVAKLDFEITEENALKLGKSGKMKVPGIGKSTAEKLEELAMTGSVAKLEELRGNSA